MTCGWVGSWVGCITWQRPIIFPLPTREMCSKTISSCSPASSFYSHIHFKCAFILYHLLCNFIGPRRIDGSVEIDRLERESQERGSQSMTSESSDGGYCVTYRLEKWERLRPCDRSDHHFFFYFLESILKRKNKQNELNERMSSTTPTVGSCFVTLQTLAMANEMKFLSLSLLYCS